MGETTEREAGRTERASRSTPRDYRAEYERRKERAARRKTGFGFDAAEGTERSDTEGGATQDGAAGAGEEEARTETVIVESPKASKRGRVAGQRKQAKAAEAGQLCSVLFMLLDTIAITAVGPQAAMSPMERGLIEPPLKRLMAEHLGAAALIGQWSDAISLVIGFSVYGMRLTGLMQAKQARQAAERPQMPEPTPIRPEPNGRPLDAEGAPMTPDMMARLFGEEL